jgi:hypothetical protein
MGSCSPQTSLQYWALRGISMGIWNLLRFPKTSIYSRRGFCRNPNDILWKYGQEITDITP